MEVLSGPWAELTLLLRQTLTQTDRESDVFLPPWLLGLLLFLAVSLLLLQLIIYLCWKLRQVEADFTDFPQDRSAIYRPLYRNAHQRRRRSVGSHSHT